MKNPWMSAWLSAANTAASAGRGFWAAELKRQQNAVLKAMTSGAQPKAPKRRAPSKRNKSG